MAQPGPIKGVIGGQYCAPGVAEYYLHPFALHGRYHHIRASHHLWHRDSPPKT